MKVFWLVTLEVPIIATKLNNKIPISAGWLTGMIEAILLDKSIDLVICYPSSKVKYVTKGKVDNLTYYSFPQNENAIKKHDPNLKNVFQKIIDDVKPDIVNIFGTEYPQSYSMMCTNTSARKIISISGMVSIIAQHYHGGLPERYQKSSIVMRLLNYFLPWNVNTLALGRADFDFRGQYEIKALMESKFVVGRTQWDFACTNQVNPNINYFKCNESLRSSFYSEKKWEVNKCVKQTIFVSQAGYPIKGFHKLIEALPLIIKKYPNVHVNVAGPPIIANRGLIKNHAYKLLNPYSVYLNKKIHEMSLDKHITFLGRLTEEQMIEQYLKANIFVLPSFIENSPNSLGEAMLLGVPSVASMVGGVQDMIKDKEEGLLYPYDEHYMLAHYICEIFSNDDFAEKISSNAKKRASITHNRNKNKEDLLEIYRRALIKMD